MRIKSSVLFGLIVVICAISGFSLLKRLTHEVDEWRPSDLYSSTNVARRSTYSVVSSAPVSYSEALPTVSSGSSSMFRRRAVSSYAPAVSAPASRLSPLASSPQGGLYTTSSAEFRSFGGGGNAGGGVSMSGGTIKSTSSSIAPATSLSISMPSTQVYTYNNGVASSDIAMASSYQGIGNTTGGAMRGISGRKNLGIDDENVEDSWLNWLAMMGTTYGNWDESTGEWKYDVYGLRRAYNAFCQGWNPSMGKKPTWDEWLAWFMGSEDDPYMWDDGDNEYGFSFVPVGDYTPLLILALLYAGFVAYRRRQRNKVICENTKE